MNLMPVQPSGRCWWTDMNASIGNRAIAICPMFCAFLRNLRHGETSLVAVKGDAQHLHVAIFDMTTTLMHAQKNVKGWAAQGRNGIVTMPALPAVAQASLTVSVQAALCVCIMEALMACLLRTRQTPNASHPGNSLHQACDEWQCRDNIRAYTAS